MDALDYVTVALGLYGSVLATVVFVDQRRRARPSLTVSCHRSYVERRREAPDDPEHVPAITIEARNTGTRPIEVRSAGFITTNGEEVFPRPYSVEPTSPPYTLSDGESVRFNYRADGNLSPHQCAEVACAFVSAGGGRQWQGAPDQWMRPLRISRLWWKQ